MFFEGMQVLPFSLFHCYCDQISSRPLPKFDLRFAEAKQACLLRWQFFRPTDEVRMVDFNELGMRCCLLAPRVSKLLMSCFSTVLRPFFSGPSQSKLPTLSFSSSISFTQDDISKVLLCKHLVANSRYL